MPVLPWVNVSPSWLTNYPNDNASLEIDQPGIPRQPDHGSAGLIVMAKFGYQMDRFTITGLTVIDTPDGLRQESTLYL